MPRRPDCIPWLNPYCADAASLEASVLVRQRKGMTASPEPDPKEVRRSKLIGRLIIIGFGLLLLVYFVPLVIDWFATHPAK